MQQTKPALQPFRVVIVTIAMVVSTTLDATDSGGLLRSTRLPMLGTGTCTTIVAMYTGPATMAAIRRMVFTYVA
jgi:hypothetical protein